MFLIETDILATKNGCPEYPAPTTVIKPTNSVDFEWSKYRGFYFLGVGGGVTII